VNLFVTERARIELGRRIVSAGAPLHSGLRICQRPGTEALMIELVAEPAPGDTVVSDRGAHVYLGPVAAQRLQDHTLDVRSRVGGGMEFVSRRRTLLHDLITGPDSSRSRRHAGRRAPVPAGPGLISRRLGSSEDSKRPCQPPISHRRQGLPMVGNEPRSLLTDDKRRLGGAKIANWGIVGS
jgi:Fe-S cluster assembly iron-binding protein IscA